MKGKSILWISPGDMAPNCAGKIGDVLVSSAVAHYLTIKMGSTIYFVTNSIMKTFIKNTYPRLKVSDLKKSRDGFVLSEDDILAAGNTDLIFILRPYGDRQANLWQQQLIESEINYNNINRIGNLDGYSINGPHMVIQILAAIGEPLPKDLPVPLFNPSSKTSAPFRENFKSDLLILPFAGDYSKWLPLSVLSSLIKKLKCSGNIIIAGTIHDKEKYHAQWLEYGKEMKNKNNVRFQTHSLQEIPLLAAKCKNIFCVDSGLTWIAVAGLNWLASTEHWDINSYPMITLIHGRDKNWNILPSAAVWRPVSKFSDRLYQVNKHQKARLIDLTYSDIIHADLSY